MASRRSRACIVTTVRDPGPSLVSFLQYHRRIGFDHIFVFFDDPHDPWLAVARSHPDVTALPCTPELRQQQRARVEGFEAQAPLLDSDVMARQVLNADHALWLARERGADWLLHLDVDELFLAVESVDAHFASIPDHVGQARYLNFEAAPQVMEMADHFRSVTLFKVHPALCSPGALEGWLSATGRRFFFTAYDNGKAAVRVVPGAAAWGVHQFAGPPGLQTVQLGYPCVLHYVNCGFENYQRKYRFIREFAETWFDRWPPLPFLRDSRELALNGDADAQRQFYRESVIYSDEHEVQDMLAAGLAVKIGLPKALLEQPT